MPLWGSTHPTITDGKRIYECINKYSVCAEIATQSGSDLACSQSSSMVLGEQNLEGSLWFLGDCSGDLKEPQRIIAKHPHEDLMEIIKSSRHQRIIGHFGEALLSNWLSRSGFEVTIVDHTGIDLVAYHPATNQRLGITVKSRTRPKGKEATAVNLLSYRKGKDDRRKVFDACAAFACEPWIAVYVETTVSADIYLTSLSNYDKRYRSRKNLTTDTWKMRPKDLLLYEADPKVKHIRVEFRADSWSW